MTLNLLSVLDSCETCTGGCGIVPNKSQLVNDTLQGRELNHLRSEIRIPACSALDAALVARLLRVGGVVAARREPVLLVRTLHMQVAADVGPEAGFLGITGGQGEVLPGQNLNGEVELLALHGSGGGIGAAVALGLEDPAGLAGEHAAVEHHALVEVLPVQGDDLSTAAPEEGWVWVGRVHAQTVGVDSHEEVAVVLEEGVAVFGVGLSCGVFGEGEHMSGYFGLWIRQVSTTSHSPTHAETVVAGSAVQWLTWLGELAEGESFGKNR